MIRQRGRRAKTGLHVFFICIRFFWMNCYFPLWTTSIVVDGWTESLPYMWRKGNRLTLWSEHLRRLQGNSYGTEGNDKIITTRVSTHNVSTSTCGGSICLHCVLFDRYIFVRLTIWIVLRSELASEREHLLKKGRVFVISKSVPRKPSPHMHVKKTGGQHYIWYVVTIPCSHFAFC